MLLINNKTIRKPAKIKVQVSIQVIKYKNVTIELDLDNLPCDEYNEYDFTDISDYAAEKLSAMNYFKGEHDMFIDDTHIIDCPNDIEWYC
jgi:hypothetical protein